MGNKIKSCPVCNGEGQKKRAWAMLAPYWVASCRRCAFEISLGQWDAFPRREEFYRELVILKDGFQESAAIHSPRGEYPNPQLCHAWSDAMVTCDLLSRKYENLTEVG